MSSNKIVIVGPTNVGKSALFNRLTKTRAAIVCDRPGVTVDRHELFMEDSPAGPITIVDTGGVGPEALAHPLGAEIERAAKAAVEESSLILFVVDGTRDMGTEELEIASWLRRQPSIDNKTIWVLANKSDSKSHDETTYFALGFNRVLSVSAEHNIGLLELWDAIKVECSIGGQTPEAAAEAKSLSPRIIVLGRPNVGKSTLLNALLGSDRHVVSEIAGTTRDPIESEYVRGDMRLRLLDTAGMRQPGRLEREVEWVARDKLKEMAKQSNVAIVVVDASQGITDLDAAIAGMALDFGLSVVIAVNKWDKMKGDDAEDLFQTFERSSDLKFNFISWCPWVRVSALTGKGVGGLMKSVLSVLEARKQRVQTSKLNQLFERRIRLHSHPLGPRGKPAKFYYLSQVEADPPGFVVFSNISGQHVHFSYKRFIMNTLRNEFGFTGTPIRVHFKTANQVQR